MRAFLISPVRGADQTENQRIVKELECQGIGVHYPARDTNQNDPTGLQICRDNLSAIKAADVIYILWDGKSTGSLFDAGMAFALGKPLRIVSLPELSEGKSFQNMFTAWANEA